MKKENIMTNNIRKKRRYEEAENNPNINQNHLDQVTKEIFKKSKFKGTKNYIGPRGGYYWVAFMEQAYPQKTLKKLKSQNFGSPMTYGVRKI